MMSDRCCLWAVVVLYTRDSKWDTEMAVMVNGLFYYSKSGMSILDYLIIIRTFRIQSIIYMARVVPSLEFQLLIQESGCP